MDQSNFQKELIESEEAFIDQFNRESNNFHGGIPTPVPVGGNRVPDSMPTMYPDTDLQHYLVTKEQDFGPEYKKVMEEKEFLDQLKKTLNKITASQEALLRNQEQQKKPEQIPSFYEKWQKIQDNEIKVLNVTIEFLANQIKYLDNQQKFKYPDLINILQQSNKQYKNKEELFEFSRMVKNTTSAIFKDNQKLTEEIKQIKKQQQKQ